MGTGAELKGRAISGSWGGRGRGEGLTHGRGPGSREVSDEVYHEPPRFPMSIRPCLGQALLDSGDAAAARAVFEADLFGLIGGRETYVVDKSGTVVSVHNNQFDPQSHVTTALAAVEELPGSPIDELIAQVRDALNLPA